ncbi:MAG: nitrilase-related carbon-nitrogen hydrolase [Steroidobacteraceae bacterium]
MKKRKIGTPDGNATLMAELSRRGFLRGGAAGAVGLALGPTPIAHAAMGKGSDRLSVSQDGRYATVPLVKDNIRLGVMQTRVRPVDPASPEKGRRENLDHMLKLITNAQEWNPPSDILLFHEFPITGFSYDWSRKDILRLSIDLPGAETEELGKAAKKYNCYIVFGSYARDKDWPGHVLSITTIIGPDGQIVDKHWKVRNIMGVFRIGQSPIELMTSTIYNCLDRYIEMYGVDAVIPVTRTPIGNICTGAMQREPELFRAMAMKGGELFLRTATGSFIPADMQMNSVYHRVYTAVCNNAVSPGNQFFEEPGGAGGSAIYDPSGAAIGMARNEFEQLVAANIPIKSFRASHKLPDFAWDLYAPVYSQYVRKYPPNKFANKLPADLREAGEWLNDPRNINW